MFSTWKPIPCVVHVPSVTWPHTQNARFNFGPEAVLFFPFKPHFASPPVILVLFLTLLRGSAQSIPVASAHASRLNDSHDLSFNPNLDRWARFPPYTSFLPSLPVLLTRQSLPRPLLQHVPGVWARTGRRRHVRSGAADSEACGIHQKPRHCACFSL